MPWKRTGLKVKVWCDFVISLYFQHPHKQAAFKFSASAVVKKEFHWVCSWMFVLLAACLQLMKLILIFLLITKRGFDSNTQVLIQDYQTIKQQLKLFGWRSVSSIEIEVVGIRIGQSKPFHGPSSLGGKICLARQNEK